MAPLHLASRGILRCACRFLDGLITPKRRPAFALTLGLSVDGSDRSPHPNEPPDRSAVILKAHRRRASCATHQAITRFPYRRLNSVTDFERSLAPRGCLMTEEERRMVALPDKGNASERWRRKATGLYRAAGLPEEASYAPPLFHDCSCRGLRCSRGWLTFGGTWRSDPLQGESTHSLSATPPWRRIFRPSSPKRKHVVIGHDHGTGEKRGWLCQECNRLRGAESPSSCRPGGINA